jgi:glucokinase
MIDLSTQTKQKLILAGDVGGTNTRLGLFRPSENGPEEVVTRVFSSKNVPGLENAVENFLRENPARVSVACIGMAGPVIGGLCKFTNLAWEISESKIKSHFNFEKVILLNDLVAMAYSLEVIHPADLAIIHDASGNPSGNIGILAPGTGLGASMAFNLNGTMHPITSEGGHVDFAPVDDDQLDLLRHLMKKYGRVSLERLLSGTGIVDIYTWLKDYGRYSECRVIQNASSEPLKPALITRAAIEEHDPLCTRVIQLFLSILGSAAGNLALTGMTTRGFYFGGGILRQIRPVIQDGGFHEAFVNKGRFRDLLSAVPIHLILTDRAALFGAAHFASRIVER